MRVPSVQPTSFEAALTLFQKKPKALLEQDRVIFLHCQEAAIRSGMPILATKSFTLAHHAVLIECQESDIVPPPANDDVIAELTREMLALGPSWDDDMMKRLRSDQRNFHTVFDVWARKKPRPEVVRHNALRAFRIFELLLQPL
jgi:hypothetical protein